MSVVGGGYSNTIFKGYGTTIGGGWNNFASSGNTIDDGKFVTIAGGSFNTALRFGATIGGGGINNAIAKFSTIGGGETNCIGFNSNHSTISGGMLNKIDGECSGILGGNSNTINHNCSFIVGSNITSNRICTTFVNNLAVCNGYVIVKNIPDHTQIESLPSGTLYKNAGGFLKIV